jgi:hypothetical protein
VLDPSNYAFAFVSTTVRGYKPPARWLIGPNIVDPGTTTGPQAAAIVLNGGTPIRGGVYQLKITSAASTAPSGVQDLAGNALDGEFYSVFPSGNNINGGDFVARLDSIHNRVFAPQTVVGPGKTPKAPARKVPVKVVPKPRVRVKPAPRTPIKAKAIPAHPVRLVRTLPAKAPH